MTATGYTTIGTVLKIDTTPFAAAQSIGYPDMSVGSLDTSPLKPTNGYKTYIPDKLIDVKAIDVQAITSVSALSTMQALLAGFAIHTFEIDFTDGDSMSFSGFMTALKSGGASESSPATEKFTISLQPTGAVTFASGATGHWYDSVDTITVAGGDFGITAGTSPKTLTPVAIVSTSGFSFIPPTADLTWASATGAKMTIGANTGIVTWVATGTSVISVLITAKAAVISEVLGTAT
jgi:hypothetical protein